METTPLTVKALHPSGFEIHLQVRSLDALEGTIANLIAQGYRPATGGDGWVRTPAGEPLCPKHQVPMRLREKQGDSWWSHQVIDPRTGEELYCRGYAGPSSPGWVVSMPA
jgi:hypothetical protein